jgi:hypothetical protein
LYSNSPFLRTFGRFLIFSTLSISEFILDHGSSNRMIIVDSSLEMRLQDCFIRKSFVNK